MDFTFRLMYVYTIKSKKVNVIDCKKQNKSLEKNINAKIQVILSVHSFIDNLLCIIYTLITAEKHNGEAEK